MAKKISVVIPNYNGINILKKTLPNVIKYSQNAQIIVIDDASQDKSVTYIHKHFKKVKVVRLKKNVGFARAINKGVSQADGEYVVLLNSDVSPRKNYLKNAIRHFDPKGKNKVFAVGFLDYSHEKDKIKLKGRGFGMFNKGFFYHSPSSIIRGNTLWVSGGSGIFKKNIFIKLGGFDNIFAPFYWEDIDLSFRAWQHGYTCLFEPLSIVDHYHEEGSILTSNKNLNIKIISYKNQFVFFWKNIHNTKQNILHILWMPYHLTKAIYARDLAFLIGFLKALAYIPFMIVNSYGLSNEVLLSGEEVLKKIEQ